MSDGFREINLTDAEQGEIRLLMALPAGDDMWGCLSPLKGTSWEPLIQVVSGEAFSHALHGWATPLVREIGIPPQVRSSRVPLTDSQCAQHGACLGAAPHCRPGPKVPECYEAPIPVASRVALAWREGRYVIVVNGKGFVLR